MQSSRPKRATVSATAPATSASRLTSARTWAAPAPSSAARRRPPSASTSAMTTAAPSATNRRTVASPMPLAPPVTSATFFASRFTAGASAAGGERGAAPALEHRELVDRLALQLRQRLHGTTERHDGGDRDVGRDAEQRLDLGLLGDGQRGDGAAETLLAGGQQDVPGERIDRRAADDAHALELGVGGGDDLEVDADHQHDGGLQHRFGQPGRRRGALDGGGVDPRRV